MEDFTDEELDLMIKQVKEHTQKAKSSRELLYQIMTNIEAENKETKEDEAS